jgi:hypothetical protein
MKKLINANYIIVFLMLFYFVSDVKSQTNFIFGKQFGTIKDEITETPVTDKMGNLYIAGTTKGDLSGKNIGKRDGFLAKLDGDGNTVWTKQFGTSDDDVIEWLAIDKTGNLFVTGYTKGNLDKKSNGKPDIIVVKFDTSGNIIWQKQYGSDSIDVGKSIMVDDKENIYVTGATLGPLGQKFFGKADAFLMKLDSKGDIIFIRQFGTPEDEISFGITQDASENISVCGVTTGDLAIKNKGNGDAFVSKYNPKGELIKTIQFGTDSVDQATRIASDKENNVYVGCYTMGDFAGKNQGQGDALLVKMNEKGDIVWSKQFGTDKWDGINGVTIKEDVSENVVISGCQNWPSCESFCRIYGKDGKLVWVGNYTANGKGGGTCGRGLWMDEKGFIYHVGQTGGSLFNTLQGEHDIFLLKLKLDKSATK